MSLLKKRPASCVAATRAPAAGESGAIPHVSGGSERRFGALPPVFPDFEQFAVEEYPRSASRQVAMARIRISGLELMLYDARASPDFTFTPATSTFVECDDEPQCALVREAWRRRQGGDADRQLWL